MSGLYNMVVSDGKEWDRASVLLGVVEVDGTPVLVRGQGTPPTQEDLDALGEVIGAAKRKFKAEHPEAGA